MLGSPRPVRCGGREIAIRKKYLGNGALVERCVITRFEEITRTPAEV